MFVGCRGAAITVRENANKGVKRMEFPSFEPVSMSPQLDDVGVSVVLGASEFKAGNTIPLYGSYLIDGEFMHRCNDEPDTWILLIVIRRDKPASWVKPVLEKPNIAPVPLQNDTETPGESVRSGGYFNLDLQDHMGLPVEPGSYWLIVTLGEYITNRIPFELVE
jgi:hypothetical protein